MPRIIKVNSAICFLLLLCSIRSYGGIEKSQFGVGLNYPGFGVRYFPGSKAAVEIKGQMDKDIVIAGLRGYYYFNPQGKYLFFTGLEGDFLSFKGSSSKGTGFAGELFGGGEHFFTKRLSLQLDIGPAFVYLSDKDTTHSLGGVEYVVNVGINCYFRQHRRE